MEQDGNNNKTSKIIGAIYIIYCAPAVSRCSESIWDDLCTKCCLSSATLFNHDTGSAAQRIMNSTVALSR